MSYSVWKFEVLGDTFWRYDMDTIEEAELHQFFIFISWFDDPSLINLYLIYCVPSLWVYSCFLRMEYSTRNKV